jgi:hypothetical protein
MHELIVKLYEKGLKEDAAIKAYLDKLDAPIVAASGKPKSVPYQDKQYSAEELQSIFEKLDEEIK